MGGAARSLCWSLSQTFGPSTQLILNLAKFASCDSYPESLAIGKRRHLYSMMSQFYFEQMMLKRCTFSWRGRMLKILRCLELNLRCRGRFERGAGFSRIPIDRHDLQPRGQSATDTLNSAKGDNRAQGKMARSQDLKISNLTVISWHLLGKRGANWRWSHRCPLIPLFISPP